MSPRARRVALALALFGGSSLVVLGASLAMSACSEVPPTNYGNPTGLRHDNLPGEAGFETLICEGGVEAGTGGACGVSWATDIFPNMTDQGPWKCASAGKCHGGGQAPTIDQTTPQSAYTSLQGYMIAGNPYPYINPDSGDPTQSTIECNLAQACGSGMPEAPGTPLTGDQLCKIDVWVRCGAPNN
jgi:hypothetical protein